MQEMIEFKKIRNVTTIVKLKIIIIMKSDKRMLMKFLTYVIIMLLFLIFIDIITKSNHDDTNDL